MRIFETDLILNPDGSVYHLGLHPSELPDYVFTVGDPDRVSDVSKYFDLLTFSRRRREFVAHGGMLNGKQVLALSTGMGTDNIDILMNELDALANIDLQERKIRDTHRSLNIIRLGTSGGIAPHVGLNQVLVTETAIGLDTGMYFYNLPQTDEENDYAFAIQEGMELPFTPYVVDGLPQELQPIWNGFPKGVTVTCPGFYGAQGRSLRLKPALPNAIKWLGHNFINEKVATNLEMETAGYYSFGRLLGHKCLSFSAIVANRVTKKFAFNPAKTVDNMIKQVLERI